MVRWNFAELWMHDILITAPQPAVALAEMHWNKARIAQQMGLSGGDYPLTVSDSDVSRGLELHWFKASQWRISRRNASDRGFSSTSYRNVVHQRNAQRLCSDGGQEPRCNSDRMNTSRKTFIPRSVPSSAHDLDRMYKDNTINIISSLYGNMTSKGFYFSLKIELSLANRYTIMEDCEGPKSEKWIWRRIPSAMQCYRVERKKL